MSTLFRFALVLILGFLFAYGMIPMIIRGAIRLRVLDFPSDARRIHRIAVPRLGGVAVFLSIVLSMGAIILYDGVQGVSRAYAAELLPLAIALSMVFGIGLIDDVIGVRPRTKLVVQTIAALVMVSSAGFVPNSIVLATGFSAVPLGYLAAPLTVIWIVGVTNAFNLIDGMDGLAGTAALIGITVCIGLDAIYPAAHSPDLMLAAAGSVIAFLVFNRHPARIFLGDAGSMVLGFLLAVRLLGCATETGGRTFLLVPLFTLALPLMDTAIAIARRWLRGDPFSQADGRHIHHQFLALGISPRVTVELLGFFFAGIAVLGVSIAFAPPRFTLALMLAAGATLFATFWYGLRWLRYHEFLALGGSMASVMRNARVALKEKIRTDEVAKQLQHAGSFDEVCEIIAALVGQTRLLDIEVFESNTDLHAHGPSRQRISAFDALPVRFDYPFTHLEGERPREMVLRIWCPRPSSVAPSYTAERVAARIGPALESWFRGRRHPAEEAGEGPESRPHLERSAESRLTGDRPSRS